MKEKSGKIEVKYQFEFSLSFMMRYNLYFMEINQVFQVLVSMRKKKMRLKMQYKTIFPMKNQLMLPNLVMTFRLVLQLEQKATQVLTIKAKQIMSQLNPYIVGETEIQQFAIIPFLNNSLHHLQKT